MTGAEARALLGIPKDWPLIPATDDDEGKRPIARWKEVDWAKYDGRQADLWALPTGKVTGVVVLDFDGDAGYHALVSLAATTNLGAHVRTGSGGYHLYITAPDYPVKTVAGVLKGVDVRGEGGIAYVAGRSRKGPYALLRPLTDPVPYDELPAATKKLLAPRPERIVTAAGTWEGTGPGTLAAVAFLKRAVADIVSAEPGTWNQTFSRAVYAISGMVAGGVLDEGYAMRELEGIGLNPEDLQVLASSWRAGAGYPWTGGGPVTLY